MLNYKDIRKDFIAYNCAITSGITTINLNSLGRGEMRVLDDKGNIIDTYAKAKAAKAIRLVQGRGTAGDYIISDLIRSRDLIRFIGKKFQQKSERKVIVGYNGSSGEIDLALSNNYMITIEHNGQSRHRNAKPYVHTVGYKTGTVAETQLTIASKLVEAAARNYEQFRTSNVMNVYKICSIAAAGETALTGTGTLSFTHGISSVSAATDIDAVLTVGDAIRLVTGVTGAVYVVDRMDTVNNIAYLDQLFMGDSVDIADSVAVSIAKGTGANGLENASSDYGIVILANTPSVVAGKGEFDMLDFTVWTKNFDTTLLSNRGTGYDIVFPSGRHEQVGISERYNQSNYQFGLDIDREYVNDRIDVKNGYGYSSVTLEYRTNEKTGTVGQDGQFKQLCIWIERETYANILANHADTAFSTNIVNGSSSGDWDVNGVAFMNVLNAFVGQAGLIANTANTVNTTVNGGESLAGGTVNGGDTKFNAGIDF